MKNREIMDNAWKIWKILPGDGSQKREVSGQNGISATLPKVIMQCFNAFTTVSRVL